MFLNFFFSLRKHGIPVSLHEYLALLEALKKDIGAYSIEDFYALSKTILVKNEAHLDRFDLIFGEYFRRLQHLADALLATEVPEEWLKKNWERELSDEEKAAIEKLGGLDALMERLKALLEQQKGQHQGGNRWIGTGGTSPFGQGGYNPEGMRFGKNSGGNRSGLKVWEQREFKNLDDRVELNTRNIKLILKRLRILTREGLADELDLDNTIRKTSENAGMLDIALRPAKKNRVKVLILFDIGGSMDEHIEMCEQLFQRPSGSSSTSSFFTFTTASMSACGKTTNAVTTSKCPPWNFCTSTTATTN
jgi:uncharacterized protein